MYRLGDKWRETPELNLSVSSVWPWSANSRIAFVTENTSKLIDSFQWNIFATPDKIAIWCESLVAIAGQLKRAGPGRIISRLYPCIWQHLVITNPRAIFLSIHGYWIYCIVSWFWANHWDIFQLKQKNIDLILPIYSKFRMCHDKIDSKLPSLMIWVSSLLLFVLGRLWSRSDDQYN